jgi:molybdopterin-biosynthesis enzyme MoeA-like protein
VAWKTCSAGRRKQPKTLFGAFIIGDELLVGKRQDKHLPFVIEALAKRGLRLSWAHYLGDEPERITAALRLSLASPDVVFSFGGIGATPDDHTRQCAARALNVELKLHPEAEREIRARFAGEATPQRLMMGEFPEGAAIIPNPVNRVPGFSVGEHHFVPGFPQMAWPMVEWVLDTRYRKLFERDRWSEASILVYEAGESQLIGVMEEVGARYPGVKVFSLPSMGPGGARIHVELGVRGVPEQVGGAIELLRAAVGKLGVPYK